MGNSPAKYFIAIVPEGKIQTQATDLKNLMKEKFNLKYALKSPAHITLKMPFLWNENKEDILGQKLEEYFTAHKAFNLILKGFDRFGRRVIFIHVKENTELTALQLSLSKFCKMELKLVEELSDRAYHPHMTIAFKDVKPKLFDEYWEFVKTQKFKEDYSVNNVALLKKVDGRWEVLQRFDFGKV
ncbi:2'-5' RNA ligase [Aquiflexum balticum DSM 16537]|uniref:2'-5' RNA ligase n=1 Tax=Aquiflexum balticum DSM 16537 TaxID=758820 RepID=A0A1W2H0J1_9BACT|nr:2'-5' RNA ligase family protein [Aquiflexum balticum]SMD42152.1 2'-5' RNA ligase [Aquiflexum balticum DSM 16537]